MTASSLAPAQQVRLGKLKALMRSQLSDKAQQVAVVLLHGYGADAQDLMGLAEFFESAPVDHWLSIEAPHTVALGPHMSGKAWFPLRLAELEQTGFHYEETKPPGMAESLVALQESIGLFANRLNLSKNLKVIVSGFSQGSMMACHAVVQKAPAGTEWAGLTLFSSALVDRPSLQTPSAIAALKGLEFFQSHGEFDPLLTMESALALEETLKGSGARGVLIPFRGGHEIPTAVLREWGSFLQHRARSVV